MKTLRRMNKKTLDRQILDACRIALRDRKESELTDNTKRHSADDLERQFEIIRDDITTLTHLLRDIGESKAGETRDAALAEAAELLERSRAAIDDGRLKARQATASVEDYIREKPVQSTLIGLGVGLLVGLVTRR